MHLSGGGLLGGTPQLLLLRLPLPRELLLQLRGELRRTFRFAHRHLRLLRTYMTAGAFTHSSAAVPSPY
eukprot:COSAG05_NODE_687_length_7922_cov_7.188035_10_plen_69_part_00